ncbi:replication associated protein [Lake Sarah-associated circular virus-42]|uniref:replication associated protein n=1 Tax=Lake Sarah-associated circular virus-42 TaxID=1685771 RepID=UPI000776E20F|nr:replication associated protein [Lake Sarah-associated circular virus-42]ALE29785.1 replication associated protein [Lake Sarah-associated circular virus-42]ALE29788.1 replication associated protein [Lake Sarah-associated circular virus-42]ALE29789.1 replication associated protein [Lake Sarah-associated circular virus-42]
MSRGKSWCFTIHSRGEGDDCDWLLHPIGTAEPPSAFWDDDPFEWGCQFMIFQMERCPETGKLHLQGALQLDKQQRLSFMKKLHKTAHWEVMKGNWTQSIEYCSKSETKVNGPWEAGDRPKMGQRTDLETIGKMVKENKTNLELVDTLGAGVSKFQKHISFLRFTYSEKDSDRQATGVKVIVLYGPTGTGKTYAAVNSLTGGRAYHILNAPSQKATKLWFDGYENQKVLVIDDFDGSVEFRYLLRMIDVYKFPAEVKGGMVWGVWDTVIITSNVHPASWYTGVDTSPLKRRIAEIRLCENQGTYKMISWEETVLSNDFENF